MKWWPFSKEEKADDDSAVVHVTDGFGNHHEWVGQPIHTWRIGPTVEEFDKMKADLALSESCVTRLREENEILRAKLRSRASKKGWDTRRGSRV